MDFIAAFDRFSNCGLLCKLKSVNVTGQFLTIVSEFLSDRRQRVCLDSRVSVSVEVLGVHQGSVLG